MGLRPANPARRRDRGERVKGLDPAARLDRLAALIDKMGAEIDRLVANQAPAPPSYKFEDSFAPLPPDPCDLPQPQQAQRYDSGDDFAGQDIYTARGY
jgi:hypothetical protein